MNSDMMHICVSSDDNYAQHLGVTLVSVLSSNPQSNFFFHVLDAGISADNKQKIEKLKKKYSFELEFIRMDEKEFGNCVIPKETHFTLPAYYRLKIPSLFPDLERVLYLDIDLIVKGDLRPLYHADLKNNWFGMIEDHYAKESVDRLALNHGRYFNSGVTLFNIRQLNEDGFADKSFDFINNHFEKIIFVDQDVINVVADGRILALPEKYNTQVILFDRQRVEEVKKTLKETCVIHYVSSIKPWHKMSNCVLRDLYYKNLLKTPWKKKSISFWLRKLQNKIVFVKKSSNTKRVYFLGVTIFKKKFFSDGKRKEKKYYFCGIPYYEKVSYDA